MELWSQFVEAGAKPHLVFLSRGELGIPHNSPITPDEMASIRTLEAHDAAAALHASVTMLSFPDLRLSFIPLEDIVNAVLPIVRQYGTDAIFAFHPFETTPEFDHPDHNITGLVAKYVSAGSDVTYLFPKQPALEHRPALYLWTTSPSPSNFTVPLSEKTRSKRNQHLLTHYPSQFNKEGKSSWITIFDRITTSPSGHQEQYVKVR